MKDKEAWCAVVHGVAQSWRRMNNKNRKPMHDASHVAQWVKNLPANAGDTGDVGLIPGLGRSPGVGNGNPLQYTCLENSMGGGTRWITV